ncbi:hypothetical protein [Cellulomonas sp. URHB0016]
MRITASARKHGVTDADILHAIDHFVRTFDAGEVLMVIGPARNGAMLEVGVVHDDADARASEVLAVARGRAPT